MIQKPLKEPYEKLLNTSYSINNECQVCEALTRGTKNLTKVESRTRKWAAGATVADIRGKIVECAWWLKKEGYKDSTIRMCVRNLKRLMKLGANLYDPENVKETIANQSTWCGSTKANIVDAYNAFT